MGLEWKYIRRGTGLGMFSIACLLTFGTFGGRSISSLLCTVGVGVLAGVYNVSMKVVSCY